MPMLMQVEYSESLPDVLSETRQEFEFEAKMAMAAKMFEVKRLSSGQAAQMLGMAGLSSCFRSAKWVLPPSI